MSLTYEMEAQGNTFHLGLLASQASALLNQTEGTALTPAELKTIEEARKCLREILTGAQTLHSGRSAAGVTTNSILSLGLAMTPLQQAQQFLGRDVLTDERFISVVNEMNTELGVILDSGRVPATSHALKIASLFFGFVADSLLSVLSLPHPAEAER